MEVIAAARGFYKGLREPGERFEVGDGQRASWFAPVGQTAETHSGAVAVSTEAGAQPKRRPGRPPRDVTPSLG